MQLFSNSIQQKHDIKESERIHKLYEEIDRLKTLIFSLVHDLGAGTVVSPDLYH